MDETASIYVGMPIVQAHLLEKNQEWVGGGCHASCLDAPFFQHSVAASGQSVPFTVPLKVDAEAVGLAAALDWRTLISTSEDFDDTLRRIESRIALAKTEDVGRKWQNTLAFLQQHRRPDFSNW